MALIYPSGKAVMAEILDRLPFEESESANSVPLKGTLRPGYSEIYRNQLSPEKLISVPHPAITTVKELIDVAVDSFGTQDCLGEREKKADGKVGNYQFLLYNEIDKKTRDLAAGIFFVLKNNPYLTDLEVHAKISNHAEVIAKGDISFIVTIYAPNRSDWVIADLACARNGIVLTALYDTLGPDTAEYILNLTESPVVIASKDKIARLVELKRKAPEKLANLVAIVLMDPLDDHIKSLGRDHKIAIYDQQEVEKLGALAPIPEYYPTPDTPLTISFTSGTTSNPKGVVLKHRAAISSMVFCLMRINYVPNSTTYCFLPLAHIYQRMALFCVFLMGARVGMPLTPTPLSLLDDVMALRPHTLLLVPRVLNKFEAAIKALTVNNDEKPLLKRLFTNAVEYRTAKMAEGDGVAGSHFVYNRLSALLRRKMGFHNIQNLSTGSAPIDPKTMTFLKASLGVGINQGYGLTETFAGVCSLQLYESASSSCGAICVNCEMRVKELPDLGYFADDPRGPAGEFLLRGPQIFTEYYKNPEETANAIDEEGWFHTGDVARIDKNGRIHIIDRVKNFFKLAQGEYISPERVENTYLLALPLVQQIFVHGDSLRSHLVGVVGADPATIGQWFFKTFGEKLDLTDVAKLSARLADPQVRAKFLELMNSSAAGLQGFEKVRNIHLAIEPLTVEDGTVTPTMKIKRPNCKQHFKKTLAALYEEEVPRSRL